MEPDDRGMVDGGGINFTRGKQKVLQFSSHRSSIICSLIVETIFSTNGNYIVVAMLHSTTQNFIILAN